MPIALMPTNSLENEIQRLQADLDSAERHAIRPEDAAANAIRERLLEKQRELYQQLEAEARVEQDRQHALQLQSLVQLEHSISDAKAEVNTLRTMLTELPQRLSRAQWELSQLLRQHAILKSELKG